MTTSQFKTIFFQDLPKFPDWKLIQTFTESAIEFYCDRSKLPLEDCENIECSKEHGHKTRSRVTEVKKAVIAKTEQTVVP